ncbi:MAG: peptidylprolyl isomerase [Pseudomonadota bacterium]
MRNSLAQLTCCLLALMAVERAQATNVLFSTPLGDFEVELLEEEAPQTVQNFLNYVRDGDYEDSFVSRSVSNFVIQGGGFTLSGDTLANVPTDPPVPNEPGVSNLRGTLAMAKRSGDPNSATSQWFVNVVDNTFLDEAEEGFTVFGRVLGDGMAVVDAINDLPTRNVNNIPGLAETPLRNLVTGQPLTADNFVFTEITEVTDPPPAAPVDFEINPGVNDAWFSPATAGQGFFFTVYPDAGQFFLSWFTYDTERPDASVTAMLGEPGHRWITAIGPIDGNQVTLSATLTSGGIFDASEPAVSNEVDYGTIVVTFQDCDTAVISYDFPDAGVMGEVTVERVVKDNIVLCEALQPMDEEG